MELVAVKVGAFIVASDLLATVPVAVVSAIDWAGRLNMGEVVVYATPE